MPWNYLSTVQEDGASIISVLYSKSHAVELSFLLKYNLTVSSFQSSIQRVMPWNQNNQPFPSERLPFQSSIQRVMPWNFVVIFASIGHGNISVLYSKSHAVERERKADK